MACGRFCFFVFVCAAGELAPDLLPVVRWLGAPGSVWDMLEWDGFIFARVCVLGASGRGRRKRVGSRTAVDGPWKYAPVVDSARLIRQRIADPLCIRPYARTNAGMVADGNIRRVLFPNHLAPIVCNVRRRMSRRFIFLDGEDCFWRSVELRACFSHVCPCALECRLADQPKRCEASTSARTAS